MKPPVSAQAWGCCWNDSTSISTSAHLHSDLMITFNTCFHDCFSFFYEFLHYHYYYYCHLPLLPLSLIASGSNHLPPHPPRPDARWCRAHVFAYSVCKPSKSDLCSCRRHLGAASRETPERIKTGPGGENALPSRVTEDYSRNDHLCFILFLVLIY